MSTPLAEVQSFPAPAGQLAFRVERGDIILLRGANGSGKTSLLRALAGLDPPVTPERVRLMGDDPKGLRAPELSARVALLCQDPRDALAGLTVAGEFRLRHRSAPQALVHLERREVATLSSGEARRVGLDLVQGPPLLLLDEPVEGLDQRARERLREMVRAHEGAVVAVDHGGLLRDLATREVDLGYAADALAGTVPKASGESLLDSPPFELVRDGRKLRFPALRMGPGLHALLGPNGSGKSTLLRALAGLIKTPQHQRREGVRLMLPHARDLFTRERVAHECPHDRMGLVPETLLERHPLSLSGGEAQRVALAKTLGAPGRVYLLDEPEAHLDAQGRAALVAAIARRVREGACVVAATHDDALAALAQSTTTLEASG